MQVALYTRGSNSGQFNDIARILVLNYSIPRCVSIRINGMKLVSRQCPLKLIKTGVIDTVTHILRWG